MVDVTAPDTPTKEHLCGDQYVRAFTGGGDLGEPPSKFIRSNLGQLALEFQASKFQAIALHRALAAYLGLVLQEELYGRRIRYGLRAHSAEGELSQKAFRFATGLLEA